MPLMITMRTEACGEAPPGLGSQRAKRDVPATALLPSPVTSPAEPGSPLSETGLTALQAAATIVFSSNDNSYHLSGATVKR